MGIFLTGKIRKSKMFVLSRRSLLSAMHIAEKKLYTAQFTSLIFPMGIFSHFAIWERIPMGLFDIFKLLIFEKIIME